MEDLGVIIAAGGSSRRYGSQDKLLMELGGLPVFLHSIRSFAPVVAPGRMAVVVRAAALAEYRELAERFLPGVKLVWVEGGACRSQSVCNGLAALGMTAGVVAVHDAARPLATAKLLLELAAVARNTGGAIAAKPVTDSLKRSDGAGGILEPVDRDGLWRAETPQVFDADRLRRAYAAAAGREFTDDAEVMRFAGFPVTLYNWPSPNLKLTTTGDLPLLAALL